jgi:hypothetical protein
MGFILADPEDPESWAVQVFRCGRHHPARDSPCAARIAPRGSAFLHPLRGPLHSRAPIPRPPPPPQVHRLRLCARLWQAGRGHLRGGPGDPQGQGARGDDTGCRAAVGARLLSHWQSLFRPAAAPPSLAQPPCRRPRAPLPAPPGRRPLDPLRLRPRHPPRQEIHLHREPGGRSPMWAGLEGAWAGGHAAPAAPRRPSQQLCQRRRPVGPRPPPPAPGSTSWAPATCGTATRTPARHTSCPPSWRSRSWPK